MHQFVVNFCFTRFEYVVGSCVLCALLTSIYDDSGYSRAEADGMRVCKYAVCSRVRRRARVREKRSVEIETESTKMKKKQKKKLEMHTHTHTTASHCFTSFTIRLTKSHVTSIFTSFLFPRSLCFFFRFYRLFYNIFRAFAYSK